MNRIYVFPRPALQSKQDWWYYCSNKSLVTTIGKIFKEAVQVPTEVLGIDVILFVSDYPYESVEDMMTFLGQLPLSQEETEQLYFHNAQQALGIPQI